METGKKKEYMYCGYCSKRELHFRDSNNKDFYYCGRCKEMQIYNESLIKLDAKYIK